MIEPTVPRLMSLMRTAPLLPVALGVILGIALDGWLRSGPIVYVVTFVALITAMLARTARDAIGPTLVVLAAGCVGGMLHLSAARTPRPSGIERFAAVTGNIARVRGVVVEAPRMKHPPDYAFSRWSYRSAGSAFLLDAEAIEGTRRDIPVDGRIRVSVREVVLDLRVGERVEVFGRLYRVQSAANPGAFDWGSYLRRQGIEATFVCDQRENVRRVDPDPSVERHDWLSWLRGHVRGWLVDDMASGADEEASLLEAMVIGHRSRLDKRLNEVFIAAGCIHFLAVSGVHVAIVMIFVRLVFGILRAGRVASTVGMLAAVVLYALIAEPRPPILRASIIATLYCVAQLLGRSRSSINWLSAAALILMAIHPLTLYDLGFQLSFAAVLGVTYLTPALKAIMSELWRRLRGLSRGEAEILEELRYKALEKGKPSSWWSVIVHFLVGIRRGVFTLLAVSAAAWLAGVPIVAANFYRIHPLGAINSLLVFPFVMVLMGLGFVKLIATAVSPWFGIVLAPCVTAIDSLLIRFVDFLSGLPGATVVCPPPPWWVVLPYYGMLLSMVAITWTGTTNHGRSRTEERPAEPARRRIPWTVYAIFPALFLAVCSAWLYEGRASNRLTMTVLAVGAGSATVIELPDGSTVLYDAGSSSPFDVGLGVIVPFLRHRRISRIDRLYVSHPNLDHFSSVPSIVAEIESGPVVVNQHFDLLSSPRSPSRHLLELLHEADHPVETLSVNQTEWEFGGATFEMLWPGEFAEGALSPNNSSTVFRISYAGYSILLTGDVEDAAQRGLIQRGGLESDVLLLPHHGSIRSSSRAFFEAVGASVLIRSSREHMEQTYSALPDLIGSNPIYNTADVGAVTVILDPHGLHVTTQR